MPRSCSRSSVSRLRRASAAVQREVSLTTGELLEPALPAMRAAMVEGLVGVDGLVAVAGPLLSAGSRIAREALLAADAALAAEARGEGPDAAPPMGADLLRVQAQAWSIALDQDGAEPRERMTAHKRSFTLGTPTDCGRPVPRQPDARGRRAAADDLRRAHQPGLSRRPVRRGRPRRWRTRRSTDDR